MPGPQSEIELHPYETYQDEIELIDLLNVLWKWKYLILIGTVAFAALAAVISFNMAKVYSIRTVLAPGIAKVDEDSKITYLGSTQEIKTLIESGGFDAKILKEIKVQDKKELPELLEFNVTTQKNTKDPNSLKVEYQTSDIDLGLQILTLLNDALRQKFDKVVAYLKEEYKIQIGEKASTLSKVSEKISKARSDMATLMAQSRSDISRMEAKIVEKNASINSGESERETQTEKIANSISNINAQIKGKELQINNLENRLSDIRNEIVRIRDNTDLLINERNKFLSSQKDGNNILASVMYTNTMQQNITYLNTLQSSAVNVNGQIYGERVAIQNLKNSIKDLESQKTNVIKQNEYKKESLLSDVNDYESQISSIKERADAAVKSLEARIASLESEKKYISEEIRNLNFKENYVQSIQILQPPKKSLNPVKPKIKLNILLAAVVGLFLTIFAAFFIEYISKHKDDTV
ncbi:chain length determinant protein [delta proteobacterium NaphS2]|nr:chain length determinant protein [delta proteobacterium NaphS2]